MKVFSLGVGIAISFVLIAKVCFESSYDDFYKDVDRIYTIITDYTQHGNSSSSARISGGVALGFMQYVPGVECATRTTGYFSTNNFKKDDKSIITGNFSFADTCFFDVFHRPILIGNPKKILNEKYHVMVSRRFAEKIAPLDEVVGKQISHEDQPGLVMTIAGVFEDFPDNGSMHYDVLMAMNTYPDWSTHNWLGNDRYSGYVKLQEGTNPALLRSAIRLMQEKNQPLTEMEKEGRSIRYYLSPFNKFHTSDPFVRTLIIILSVVSVVLLGVSLMNYGLIAISEMVERSKQIGVLKCYGAQSADLYRMLITKTLATVGLSLLLSVVLIWAFQPLIEELMGVKLLSMLIPETLIMLAGILLLLIVLSVVIPGYLYSRVPVGVVFRRYKANKRTWKLSLLLFQFVINIFLLCFLLVVSAQYNKALNADVSYSYDRLYYSYARGVSTENIVRCVALLKKQPKIEAVERAYGLPLDGASGNNIYLPNDSQGELFNVADCYSVTAGFLDMLQIPIEEGRLSKPGNEVMVSRRFVEKMKEFADWKDGAIGKEILISEHSDNHRDPFVITGIYSDYGRRCLLHHYCLYGIGRIYR